MQFVGGPLPNPTLPGTQTITTTGQTPIDWGKFKQEQAKPAQQSCPHCGYCPHCGRGGWHYYPQYPYYPQITYTVASPGYPTAASAQSLN